jgi:hypothetical protein
MTNKESLDIFGQLLSEKQIVIGKSRKVGKTYSTQLFRNWQVTFDKHIRSNKRKESIKKLFNI